MCKARRGGPVTHKWPSTGATLLYTGPGLQDKLALFRQQASVIARKKEDAMESYKAAYDDVEAGERELKDMRAQLQATGDRVSHTIHQKWA